MARYRCSEYFHVLSCISKIGIFLSKDYEVHTITGITCIMVLYFSQLTLATVVIVRVES